MSTRLYFGTPTSYTELVDPADVTATVGWVDMPVAPLNPLMNLTTTPADINTPETSYTRTAPSLTANVPRNVMMARYISPPIAGGTYASSLVKSILRTAPQDSRVRVFSQMSIRLVGPDGKVKAGAPSGGVLLPLHADNPGLYNTANTWTGGTGTALYPTSPGSPNRSKFPKAYTGSGTAIAGFTAEDGDRLLVEIGARVQFPSAGSPALTLRYGTATGGTDYPETVGVNTNTPVGNGWIEFSSTITFLPEPRDVTLDLDSSTSSPATITDTVGGPSWTVSGGALPSVPALTSKYGFAYEATPTTKVYTNEFPSGTHALEIFFEHPGGVVSQRLLDWNANGDDGFYITSEDEISVLGETFSDLGYGVPHHLLVSLTGDGYLDLYLNGEFIDRRATPYETLPGGDAWLNGSPTASGPVATTTTYQAFRVFKNPQSAATAVARYRAMVFGAYAVSVNFSDPSGNFTDVGATPGTAFVPINAWNRGTPAVVSGYARSATSAALGSYVSASGLPSTAKGFDLLFQTDFSATETEMIALGSTGQLYLQISDFDSLSLFYNGVLLTQSDNFVYYDGGPTYVQVNLDGTGGGEMIVGSPYEGHITTWPSGGPTTLTSGAGRINGYANSPGTGRYQDKDTTYQAFNMYEKAASTLLDSRARFVMASGYLAASTVGIEAARNGAGAVNVTVNVGSLADVTMYRILGDVSTSPPEVLYRDRRFIGDFLYVDTTSPFDEVVTYRAVVRFVASGSTSTYQTSINPIGAPSADAGSCYPAYLNDPQDPNNVPIGVTLQTLYPMDYDARTGVFDIVGEAAPVAVNSSRSTPKYTMTVMSHTEEGARRLRDLLGTGRPVYIRVPSDARPDKPQWFASVQTVNENQVFLDDIRTPIRKWNLEVIEVQRPDTASGLSAANTWAGVKANNASFTSLAARASTWYNVVNDTNIGSVPG
jgi:hypothetical protein